MSRTVLTADDLPRLARPVERDPLLEKLAEHDAALDAADSTFDTISEKDSAAFHKDAADALASTTTAAKAFYASSVARTMSSVVFVPAANLTADDTNYATITVKRRDADGANPATVAAILTKITGGTGNWTAFLPIDFGALSQTALAAGGQLTVEIAKAVAGVAVPAGELVVTFAQAKVKVSAEWHKDAADAAAGTATAEKPVYVNKTGVTRTMTGIRLIPAAALTAHNTNFATITVRRRDADGGNATTVADITTEITGTGNWVAFTPVLFGALSVTALADGAMLTVEITKAAGGVAVPASQVEVDFE